MSQFPETFNVTLCPNFGRYSVNIGTLYGRGALDAFAQNNCGNRTFLFVERHRLERMEDGRIGSLWEGNEIHCMEEDTPKVMRILKKHPNIIKRKLVSWSRTTEHGTWGATITENI